MGFSLQVSNLDYGVRSKPDILKNLNVNISSGQFVAVLGENGAGKTTFIDLLMGFRQPTSGQIYIEGQVPLEDPYELRQHIAYLSEKVDIPGDWSVLEFLRFNQFFYKNYSSELEADLLKKFQVDTSCRVGTMSAGEIRRVQIVSALAIQPKLIVVDEITAVLDIVGRRQFMKILADLNKNVQCTVILATNILEELGNYISDLLVISHGQLCFFKPVKELLGNQDPNYLSQIVADMLEPK
jgi:ABC-type branched-subunit amino acid transport system ATPase component